MIVETICDRCGMSYDWPGVEINGRVYCCAGCASGGPCTCDRTAVVEAGEALADDTVIVEA